MPITTIDLIDQSWNVLDSTSSQVQVYWTKPLKSKKKNNNISSNFCVIWKFSPNQRSNNIITQEIIESELRIEDDLNWFNIANFQIPFIDWIEEDVRVDLYEVWNVDTKIFSWFIYKIEPIRNNRWVINIECRSEKAIFNKRLILSDKSFSWVSIKTILNDVLDDYNTYWDRRTLSCDFDKNITIDIKQGDKYFDVLDELSEQCEANRDIRDWVVLFKQNIWTDYSNGDTYQEIYFNWFYPNTCNISSIKVSWTATQSNIVMVKDRGWNVTIDSTWYVDFVYWVWKLEIRDWDTADKLAKFKQTSNQKQRNYEIDLEQNVILANIWDKLKLVVENTNSFFDINTTVSIIKKNTVYTNASKQVSYTVWEIKVTPQNIENRLFGIQKDIRLLQIG